LEGGNQSAKYSGIIEGHVFFGMNEFFNFFQKNHGNLLRIKQKLFWHNAGLNTNTNTNQIALILDSKFIDSFTPREEHVKLASAETNSVWVRPPILLAHLLIDSTPSWVIISKHDVEFVTSQVTF
jgi:hypothetical protein